MLVSAESTVSKVSGASDVVNVHLHSLTGSFPVGGTHDLPRLANGNPADVGIMREQN